MLVGEAPGSAHLLKHAKFFRADPCTSLIKLSAMLMRFGTFRFRNIATSTTTNLSIRRRHYAHAPRHGVTPGIQRGTFAR